MILTLKCNKCGELKQTNYAIINKLAEKFGSTEAVRSLYFCRGCRPKGIKRSEYVEACKKELEKLTEKPNVEVVQNV